MLNRHKQLPSVRPDFACITQPDGQETPPNLVFVNPSGNLSSSSCSDLRDSVHVITQTFPNEESEGVEVSISTSDLKDDDPNRETSIRKDSPTANSKNWLKKLSKKSAAKAKHKTKYAKKMTKEEKKLKKFKIGSYVYTRQDDIADFHPDDKPMKGKRRIRENEYGTIIKKSTYYNDCFVVAFDKGFSATVSFRSLYYVSASSKNFKFVRGPDGKFQLEKVNGHTEEQEAIMRVIVNSKIHRTIGYNLVTYDYLVSLFKPQYSWLTSSKLRKYVSKCKKLLEVNTQSPKAGTWLCSLPAEEPDSPVADKSGFRSCRLFNSNSHKHANIVHLKDKESSDSSNIARANHSPYKSEMNPVTHDTNSSDEISSNNDVENHGIACTCCGIRFKSLITEDDMNELFQAKRFTKRDMMITKVVICDEDRRIETKIVPNHDEHKINLGGGDDSNVGGSIMNNYDSSKDSVEKHSRYVANGYTDIDSNDEAVATSELVACKECGSSNDGNVGDEDSSTVKNSNDNVQGSSNGSNVHITNSNNEGSNDGTSVTNGDGTSEGSNNDSNEECIDDSNVGLSDGTNTRCAESTSVGSSDGTSIGRSDGISEGTSVRCLDGTSVGSSDGTNVASSDGTSIGRSDGISDSTSVRCVDGTSVGSSDGISIGRSDGTSVGHNDGPGNGTSVRCVDGTSVGSSDGISIGRSDGTSVGHNDGPGNGTSVRCVDGTSVGSSDGISIGRNDGTSVGHNDGTSDCPSDGTSVLCVDGTSEGSSDANSIGRSDGTRKDSSNVEYNNGSFAGVNDGKLVASFGTNNNIKVRQIDANTLEYSVIDETNTIVMNDSFVDNSNTFASEDINSNTNTSKTTNTGGPKIFSLDDEIAPYSSTDCTKCKKIPTPCPYEQYPEVVAHLANSK